MDPSATPLSNADFRKLLETPRAERGTPRAPAPRPSPRPKPSEGAQKPKKPHYKPKPKAKEDEEQEPGSMYRDRAEERRRGINPDYESVNQLASVLGSSDVDVSKLSVEESKFLGGDLDHTHLVKGLDYALLMKERMKLEKQQQDEGVKGQAAKSHEDFGMPKREELSITNPVARGIFDVLFNPPKVNVQEMFLPRRTAFVYDFDNEESLDTDIPTTLRRSKADCPSVIETVMAGIDSVMLERLAKIMSYIKTTADGKKLKKKDREQIQSILAGAGAQQQQPPQQQAPAMAQHQQQQQGHGRPPAPEAAAAASGVAKDDIDDDIFGDAGTDYKPSVSKKKDDIARRAEPQPVDMDMDEGEIPAPQPPQPPPPPPGLGYAGGYGYPAQAGPYSAAAYDMSYQQQGQGYADAESYEEYVRANVAYQAANDPEYQALLARHASGTLVSSSSGQLGAASCPSENEKWRVKPTKTEQKDVDFEEAAYAECYPMQAGFVAEVVDSDEEDFSQMDTGGRGKGKGASRYDFNTEEEWERYKETREQMPKAAFQFGVKMTDGRKTHKDLSQSSDKARDQKLNNQLHKIERLLKDKGFEHGRAFGRDKARGKAQTGNDPSLSVEATPGRKRQRI